MQNVYRASVKVAVIFAVLLTGCSEEDLAGGGTGVFFIGHSQVNHIMPGYFQWLLESSNSSRTVRRQVIGGGNLEEAFVLHAQTTDTQDSSLDPNPKYAYFSGRLSGKGTDAVEALAAGGYSQVVLAEEHGLTQAQCRESSFKTKHSVTFPAAEDVNPTGDNYLRTTFQNTFELGSGLSFYHNTVSVASSAQVYLYEMWFPVVNGQTHCNRVNTSQATKTLAEINSWRKRIHSYIPAYAGLASEINERRGTNATGFSYGTTNVPATDIANGAAVTVIPVAQAVSVLISEICAGNVSTLTNPNELFSDNVHASELGNYFVALVMYAALQGLSPEGITLTGDGTGRALDGNNIDTPDANVASVMQTIAWGVVSGTLSATNTDIASCAALTQTTLPEPQSCIDASDTEAIPVYP